MRSKAGRRALGEARRLRAERQRAIGWRYIPGIVIYCVFASVFIVWFAWSVGPNAAWFACGVAVGTSLLIVWITADSVGASRQEMGGFAEQWTEHEIRKLRRSGWRVVSNIPFERCDVDHVAIGPAGVVVLETKWSDGSLFTKRGNLSGFGLRALDQVEENANKIERVLAQCGYSAGVNGCQVVVWGSEVPGEPLRVAGRRGSVIAGDRLGVFLEGKPTRLTAADIEAASAALESWLTPRLATMATNSAR